MVPRRLISVLPLQPCVWPMYPFTTAGLTQNDQVHRCNLIKNGIQRPNTRQKGRSWAVTQEQRIIHKHIISWHVNIRKTAPEFVFAVRAASFPSSASSSMTAKFSENTEQSHIKNEIKTRSSQEIRSHYNIENYQFHTSSSDIAFVSWRLDCRCWVYW